MTFLVFGGNVSIHLFNNCFSTYFEPDSVSDTEDTAGNKADNNCGPHCASRITVFALSQLYFSTFKINIWTVVAKKYVAKFMFPSPSAWLHRATDDF